MDENFCESLGKASLEIFGFSNEDELNRELLPLMEEVRERENQ